MSRVANADSYQVGSGHLAAIYQATVTLTDAQIKALPTTPITLVAAPASGYRLKVIGASIRVNASAGAYTNVNATYASIQVEWDASGPWATGPIWNDSTTTPATADVTALLASAATKLSDFNVPYVDATQYWPAPGAVLTSVINGLALRLSMDNNSSGNLTGGNGSNSGRVVVYYTIEAL